MFSKEATTTTTTSARAFPAEKYLFDRPMERSYVRRGMRNARVCTLACASAGLLGTSPITRSLNPLEAASTNATQSPLEGRQNAPSLYPRIEKIAFACDPRDRRMHKNAPVRACAIVREFSSDTRVPSNSDTLKPATRELSDTRFGVLLLVRSNFRLWRPDAQVLFFTVAGILKRIEFLTRRIIVRAGTFSRAIERGRKFMK